MKRHPYARSVVIRLLLATACLAGGASGCWPGQDSPSSKEARIAQQLGFRPPVPTKDDVVLVDGRALSISGFLALRGQLPSTSVEDTYRLAVAALALQNDAQKQGFELSPASAVLVAQYTGGTVALPAAEGPLREYLRLPQPGQALPSLEDLKARVGHLVAHSVVQRNPQALAEIH